MQSRTWLWSREPLYRGARLDFYWQKNWEGRGERNLRFRQEGKDVEHPVIIGRGRYVAKNEWSQVVCEGGRRRSSFTLHPPPPAASPSRNWLFPHASGHYTQSGRGVKGSELEAPARRIGLSPLGKKQAFMLSVLMFRARSLFSLPLMSLQTGLCSPAVQAACQLGHLPLRGAKHRDAFCMDGGAPPPRPPSLLWAPKEGFSEDISERGGERSWVLHGED